MKSSESSSRHKFIKSSEDGNASKEVISEKGVKEVKVKEPKGKRKNKNEPDDYEEDKQDKRNKRFLHNDGPVDISSDNVLENQNGAEKSKKGKKKRNRVSTKFTKVKKSKFKRNRVKE